VAATSDGSALTGEYRHAGVIYPLRCVRGDTPDPPRGRRPQTPKAPFPYTEETVSFTGADGTRREGTLTRPTSGANGAAVALSSWLGAVDRDQAFAGHRPLALWADQLTRRGLITLRYDKRGIGASGGDFDQLTTGILAEDLAQAVAFLRHQPGVAPARVGVMGHSEGGHASAEAAAADPAIAFCVMLTPSGRPEEETFETELFRDAEAVGARVLQRERWIVLLRALSAAARQASTPAEAVERSRAVLQAAGGIPPAMIEARAAGMATPWRWFWLRYDPTVSLRRLRCPTLVLFAGQDFQTAPAWHAPPIRAALADHPGATLIELPGLNHALQTARTGAPSEYAEIEETVSPRALQTVCDWMERVARA
jgi:pimeloyl-ACP methyl ester carboxylesterase